ncbi:phosphatases II [Thozetella sp. PMI_491]|nr:phosphatases II [Thozetella sp. PMI_491]
MPLPKYKQVYRNTHALQGGQPELGDLYLQDHHLIFCFPPESKTKADPSLREKLRWFAYPVISHCCLRATPPSSGIPPSLRIQFRDFLYATFNFDNNKNAQDAFEFIRSRTAKLGSIEKLLAFEYQPHPQSPEARLHGWDVYDPRAEFRRQGISTKSTDKGWRISTINKDYVFSPTYPALLAVPSKISDNTLKYASSFRSRARIPALTYLHPVNNCSITRCSQPLTGLTFKRSVQDESLVAACFSASTDFVDTATSPPLSQSPAASQPDLSVETLGETDQQLSDTEQLEDALIAGTAMYDEKGRRLIYGAQQHNLIVDARPALNSYAMQAQGMGSEKMENYKFAKKAFLNIDNIHVMRGSLDTIIRAIRDADVSPLPPNQELLAKSKWIKHITGILDGSAIIARQVAIQHSHVLIHCSDGWDRTSQLSALAQLMLDPYYRTIDGFIVLVEKDWLSFGHMFQLRSGHLSHDNWFTVENDALAGTTIKPGENDGRNDAFENAFASAKRFFNKNLGSDKDEDDVDDEVKLATAPLAEDQATQPKNISPVFHQFLDATYQLLRQHPARFEFNERFLRRLLYHLYSCQYGTFLYNNERQRKVAKVEERTKSVWAYFLSRREEFTNKEYDATVDDHVKGQERLIFPRLEEVRWWHQVFNRSDQEMNGALDAAAATAAAAAAYQASSGSGDGAGAYTNSHPGTPRRSAEPASLQTSRSVLTSVETAHEALTPEMRTPPSLNRSASTSDAAGAFAALTGRFAELGNVTKDLLAGAGGGVTGRGRLGGNTLAAGSNSGAQNSRAGSRSTSRSREAIAGPSGDQELKEY